jgi:hypothetical protein
VSGEACDPPDDEFWCKRCAKHNVNYYVKQGWVPNYWHKPRWTYRAAEKLGLIEIVEGINSWTIWHDKSKPIPKGWLTLEERYKDMR